VLAAPEQEGIWTLPVEHTSGAVDTQARYAWNWTAHAGTLCAEAVHEGAQSAWTAPGQVAAMRAQSD